MSEIKFRGKDDNGNWHFGDLSTSKHFPPQIVEGGLYTRFFFVDPATVGQYTGLSDKDGNGIYEGDIVRLSPQFSVKQGLKREFRYPAVVRWDERLARFSLRSPEIISNIPDSEYISVIGNVYDNPNLLEAAHDQSD